VERDLSAESKSGVVAAAATRAVEPWNAIGGHLRMTWSDSAAVKAPKDGFLFLVRVPAKPIASADPAGSRRYPRLRAKAATVSHKRLPLDERDPASATTAPSTAG
jgi:hypothetical protein